MTGTVLSWRNQRKSPQRENRQNGDILEDWNFGLVSEANGNCRLNHRYSHIGKFNLWRRMEISWISDCSLDFGCFQVVHPTSNRVDSHYTYLIPSLCA